MLAMLIKDDYKQPLVIFGHLSNREVNQFKSEGYRVQWREKPSLQINKNGIPREGDTSCQSVSDATSHSKRLRASKSGSGRSAKGNTTRRKRSS